MGEIEDFILKAKDKLEVANLLYEKEFYGDSVSSSYYAMLLISKALLLKKGHVSKTHKGLIHQFNEHYIKEDNFNRDIYKDFVRTETLRNQVDYDATDTINQRVSKNKLDLAERFFNEAQKFL